jgi:hypothetical protein
MSGIIRRNEHKVERLLRVVLGLALISVYVIDRTAWWGLVGVVPLLTGVLGTCPLYSIFGFSTCPRDGAC